MSMDNSAFSGLGAVIGSGMDFAMNNALASMAANRQLSNSKKMFDYTFQKQNQRQDFLNAMSGTIEKQSLKNAGLSAASLNGAPFSGNVASGSGITGSDAFAQANFFNNMLQAKQLQIQDKLADADIQVKEAEANKLNKEIPWIDKVNQATIETQNSIRDVNLGTNERENKKIQHEIDSIIEGIDLTKEQKSYQHYMNLAMEKTYNIDGELVKGYEIPNFRDLVNLKIAEKTLEVAKYNAETERQSVEGAWDKFLVNDFLRPMLRNMKRSYQKKGYIGMLIDAFKGIFTGDILDDEEHTEVGGEPVE